MKRLSMLGLSLTLALPLLVVARPAAAAQPTVAAQAAGDKDPFATLFIDDANGNVTVDSQKGGKVHDAFAGLPYVITSDGKLEIGSSNGSGLHLVGFVQDVSGGKGLSFIAHGPLAANSGLLITGEIFRFSDDPTKGNAFLLLAIPQQGGGVESAWVEQALTFAGSNPNPSPSPTPSPNPFGF